MKDNTPFTPTAVAAHPPPALERAQIDAGLLSNSQEFPIREYIKVLFKYRVLIAMCAAASVLLALVYAFTATPFYTATTKMRISTYEPILTATKIEDMLQEKSKEANYLETQLEEMKSFSLADRVLQDPAVKAVVKKNAQPSFLSRLLGRGSSEEDRLADQNPAYKSSPDEIKSYLDAISVRPIRKTSLVVVDATNQNPGAAALIANKHAQAYIEWVRTSRVEQQARGLQFLRSQADELREKVADLEREMSDYAEANSIVALNKDENIVAQKMSQLNALLTASTGRKIEAENTWREAQAALNSPSAGFDDPSTQDMRRELGKLQGEYSQGLAKFTPEYPRMRELSAQIEGVKGAIQNQRQQVVKGLGARALAAEQEEKNLREELEQQKSQAFELSKRQVQYNVLNRELTTSRELLESVLKQIKETSLAVESNSSNISVVDYAAVPKRPAYPRKSLILMLGLVFGVGLGVGAAFFLNYLDNTVRTPEDLVQLLSVPSLGVVPSFNVAAISGPPAAEGAAAAGPVPGADLPRLEGEQGLANLPIIYLKEPKSLAAEAYRTIRTAILLSQAGEPPRTILVSSAQSSEGKTTSSINLAASLASAGGRVVIIDADLRRPSVSKHFGLAPELPGLVEVITGLRNLHEVTIEGLIKRVTVIPSGRIPPNPAELLGSLEMATLLDRLAADFDYVLIDSPPVLPVTDSVILSRYVDGVVLVVRGAATPRKIVRDAMTRLHNVGARVLGAVLNDVDVRSGDYYYYNRYYSAYYSDHPHQEKTRATGGV